MQINNWKYSNPVTILKLPNDFVSISSYIEDGNTLIITSPTFINNGTIEKITNAFNNIEFTVISNTKPNPELADINTIAKNLPEKNFCNIIALGGGSVIDTAKAISVMINNEEFDGLEEIINCENNTLAKHNNLIAIPTTSGTGSEVTPFATIWDQQNSKKLSLSGDFIYPSKALLIPELTLSLPESITVNSALDSISHALESKWNKHRSPISQLFANESLKLSVNNLKRVIDTPKDVNSRSALQAASTYSGIAISQTKTAIAHSISYPLTLHLGVPHGLAAGFCLPELIKYYLESNFALPEDSYLLTETLELLNTLSLPKRIGKFASYNEIYTLTNEMIDKSRAANYFLHTDTNFIRKTVSLSLKT